MAPIADAACEGSALRADPSAQKEPRSNVITRVVGRSDIWPPNDVVIETLHLAVLIAPAGKVRGGKPVARQTDRQTEKRTA